MSAVPPPYDRQATFTSFHTEPAPTVGQDLEAEFNAVKQSQDATQSRLREIQRDDGRLSNLSVHPDALSDAVRVLLGAKNGDIRGLWQTAQVYNTSDVIEGPDSVTYIAVTPHVANASFAVDLSAGRWIAIDSGKSLDTALRADLADDATGLGASMIGYLGSTVKAFLDSVTAQFTALATAVGSTLIGFQQAGSALVMSIHAKLLNIRHVTDWPGVDKTGATDSTVGILAAMSACAGKDLYWPPGGYKISDELPIMAALRMYCPIGSVEIRQATPNKNHIRVGDGTALTRAATLETVIDGFIFVPQPGTAASTSGACIRTQYAANLNVRNCVFYGRDGAGRKLWKALELDRCEDSRIVDCKALEFRNRAIDAYGAAGLANRTVDVRIEQFRSFNCDGDQVVFGPHSGGMFLTNWICLGVTAGASGLVINADPATEQGTNYFIVNPNVEIGQTAGANGITVLKGQAVDISLGWIGGVSPTGKTFHFATGASSCSIKGTRVDGGQAQIDGPACTVADVEFSGFGTDAVGLTVTAGATGTMISGRFRQFTTFGIDLQGSPQQVVIGPAVFANIGTRYINGSNYTGGPSVVNVRSDTSPTLIAAATLPINYGQNAYQATGGTVISGMTLLAPGSKVSIQAGAGGLSWASGANLILKATPAAQPAFSLMEFTMIGGVWYETSRSF